MSHGSFYHISALFAGAAIAYFGITAHDEATKEEITFKFNKSVDTIDLKTSCSPSKAIVCTLITDKGEFNYGGPLNYTSVELVEGQEYSATKSDVVLGYIVRDLKAI
ncbi:MAG: hypothetical protein JKY04_04150 [Sneathiella sp.]|nr:hypothetical protein [Sneathiella sp.]